MNFRLLIEKAMHEARDEFGVAAVTLDESRFGRHEPATAGQQAVQDQDLVTAIEQRPRDMRTDIAGAGCPENPGSTLKVALEPTRNPGWIGKVP